MSLSTDDIDDIKQLLASNNALLLTEFRQELEETLDQKLDEKLDQKLDEKLDQKLKPIANKIDDLTDFVRESLDTSNEATGEQLTDHERRITKLEQKAV